MIRALLAVLAVATGTCCEAAEPVPVRSFARLFAEYESAKISPTGKYLAVEVPVGNQTALGVIDLDAMKLTAALNFNEGEHVHEYWWVGPDRVAVSIAKRWGPLDQPRLTGELMAMNANGAQKTYLYGYRGAAETGSRLQRATKEYGWAVMIDPMPEDPEHALVGIRQALKGSSGEWSPPEIALMDMHTGSRKRIVGVPGYENFRVVADAKGVPRAAESMNEQGEFQLFASGVGDEVKWQPVEFDTGVVAIRLRGIDRSGASAYVSVEMKGGQGCLRRLTLETRRFDDISCSKSGPIGTPVFSFDGDQSIGVVQEPGRPNTVFFDPSHPDAALMQVLQQSFPGQHVTVTSKTLDGKKLVLLVYSDRNPGKFYLFDRATNKARYLVSRRGWIDPNTMQPSEAIEYKTRDGALVHGFLTAPQGLKARNLPLVVMPHGGPHGVRDWWGWHPDAQFLASRGYAVLQPNFRGSAGYGRAFEEAGYRKWGTLMQDDLTDAVRWAVAQGIADPGRVCIYGVSYGGYAALMSATREPDLYRCAAGVAGVYDLASFQDDTDYQYVLWGRLDLKKFLGEDESEWAKQSPITHIERLKIPVMLAHGTADRLAPFSQAKQLRSALEKHGKAYEWVEYTGEEHGFYKEANRIDFLEKLAAFLDRHIGAKAESPAAKP
jgi:dienelactone hydrolase